MPFGIQPIHLIIIVIVALIIFGPSRLPEIGRGLGKALAEFRKGTKEMTESFREEILSTSDENKIMGAAPQPYTPPQPSTQPQPPQQPQVESQALSQPQPMPQSDGNFCTQCGSPNPPDARFCNKCGYPLPVAPLSQNS